MTLLIQHTRRPYEGPRAHRLRVLQANLLPGTFVGLLDTEFGDQYCNSAWVSRCVRWCPNCLATDGYGRVGWELRFADACAMCGHWLLDTCSTCGQQVCWTRHALEYCSCGADLRLENSQEAPSALVDLSRSLEQRFANETECTISALATLSVEQCSQLTRLLGTYGGNVKQRIPQKVLYSDLLQTSWPISTMAAETLTNWPFGFHWLLNKIQHSSSESEHGRMVRAFGGFYRALYKGLANPVFDWVREAFEDYLAEHWTGFMGRQNRRTSGNVLQRLEWIPAPVAAKQLGVSSRRLTQLIDSSQLDAKTRRTSSGRQYISVNKSKIDALRIKVSGELTVAQAATRLGLTRHRLARLLPSLCPLAIQTTVHGGVWAIPLDWIEGWERRFEKLCQVRDTAMPDEFTVDYALRYWPIDDSSLVSLILDFERNEIVAVGTTDAKSGLSGIVFSEKTLRKYRSKNAHVPSDLMTVVEVAHQLKIKQEVAYAIVRCGLLRISDHRIGRRNIQMVHLSELTAFENQYVFARELAKRFNRSSRAVISSIERTGVTPICGPSVDGCRQVIYRRVDLLPIFA